MQCRGPVGKTRSPTHPPSASARQAGCMPKSMTSPDARPVPDVTAPARDRAVDVARLGRSGGRDVRALRAAARHHRRRRCANRQPPGCLARHRARDMGRSGDAVVLPGRRCGGRLRLAFRHAVGHVAVHQGAAAVPSGVLVSRGVDRWSAGGAVDARGGVRRGRRTRERGTAVVSRRVPRGAGLRPGVDASGHRACGRRRGGRPPRRRGRGGSGSIRRRAPRPRGSRTS